MDALISQLADLEPAQRWSLLCRLARTCPAETQHALAQIQRTRHEDIVVTGYRLHGDDVPESLIAS
jgi:hypothetical protein